MKKRKPSINLAAQMTVETFIKVNPIMGVLMGIMGRSWSEEGKTMNNLGRIFF